MLGQIGVCGRWYEDFVIFGFDPHIHRKRKGNTEDLKSVLRYGHTFSEVLARPRAILLRIQSENVNEGVQGVAHFLLSEDLHCSYKRMAARHIKQYVQFQLCVCVYICVCSVPGVPSPSFVISPSVDCDMETPAISFTQLFTGFRLPERTIPFCPPSRVPSPPFPLPLFLSSRVAAPFGFLAVYQTYQWPPPPSSLAPAHACLCLRSSE